MNSQRSPIDSGATTYVPVVGSCACIDDGRQEHLRASPMKQAGRRARLFLLCCILASSCTDPELKSPVAETAQKPAPQITSTVEQQAVSRIEAATAEENRPQASERPEDVALEPDSLESIRAGIRKRTKAGFTVTDFVKPMMQSDAEVDPYLAPILYREFIEGSSARIVRLGALVQDAHGNLSIDKEQPTVYYSSSRAKLMGREYEQVAFTWFGAIAEGAAQWQVQGIRATLDEKGFPKIIELLRDASGMRVIFVAQAMETAAAEGFGEALTDRSFAIESSKDEWPQVLVAATYKEGPQPMGPMLYQAVGSSDLTALHCRCSPSLIESIRDMVEYKLVPLQSLEEMLGFAPDWSRPAQLEAGAEPANTAEVFSEADWLDRCLRLTAF
ncbi:MAG: hypothetical protein ACI841_004404 [Planctomycetota bacterium]|jgi:hypothetical protein